MYTCAYISICHERVTSFIQSPFYPPAKNIISYSKITLKVPIYNVRICKNPSKPSKVNESVIFEASWAPFSVPTGPDSFPAAAILLNVGLGNIVFFFFFFFLVCLFFWQNYSKPGATRIWKWRTSAYRRRTKVEGIRCKIRFRWKQGLHSGLHILWQVIYVSAGQIV